MTYQIILGDCLEKIKYFPDASIDAVITDPPYGLSEHSDKDIMKCLTAWIAGETYNHQKSGFMGNDWDNFPPGPIIWKECLRVLKPGGHLLCFGGTRCMDILSMAIRLAGFELRDAIGHLSMISWVYGSGMPKGINISNKIFTETNNEQLQMQWDGWNTTLKPAYEPILMCRKPFDGPLYRNVINHGVGGININGCRTTVDGLRSWRVPSQFQPKRNTFGDGLGCGIKADPIDQGRWPTNLIIESHQMILDLFPDSQGQSGSVNESENSKTKNSFREMKRSGFPKRLESNKSSARFFSQYQRDPDDLLVYQSKVSPTDRHEGFENVGNQFNSGTTLRDVENLYKSGEAKGNTHPTVKPVNLMRHLCKLVTPTGGVILDPFMGSGSTLKAAILEGFNSIGIERDASYLDIAKQRLIHAQFQKNNQK